VEIGDVREIQQATERADLDRDTLGLEGVTNEGHVLVLSKDHSDVAPSLVFLGVEPYDLLGYELGFVDRSAKERGASIALSGSRHRLQSSVGLILVHGSTHCVGCIQDCYRGSPILREWQGRSR
jgi:hypothetical protein